MIFSLWKKSHCRGIRDTAASLGHSSVMLRNTIVFHSYPFGMTARIKLRRSAESVKPAALQDSP